MKISELIAKLTKEKEINGDITVIAEAEYTCGDYGDFNCTTAVPIERIVIRDDLLVLGGTA